MGKITKLRNKVRKEMSDYRQGGGGRCNDATELEGVVDKLHDQYINEPNNGCDKIIKIISEKLKEKSSWGGSIAHLVGRAQSSDSTFQAHLRKVIDDYNSYKNLPEEEPAIANVTSSTATLNINDDIATPEQTATTPEQTATTPEQTATTPEQTATTPEQTATTPEQTATTPEQTDATHKARESVTAAVNAANKSVNSTTDAARESVTAAITAASTPSDEKRNTTKEAPQPAQTYTPRADADSQKDNSSTAAQKKNTSTMRRRRK
jgi:hypothetical protein